MRGIGMLAGSLCHSTFARFLELKQVTPLILT